MNDTLKAYSDPAVEEQVAKWMVNDFSIVGPHLRELPLDYLTTDAARAVHRAVTRLLKDGKPVIDDIVIFEAARLVGEESRPIIYCMIAATGLSSPAAFLHHADVLRDYWKHRTLQAAIVKAGATADPLESAAILQTALEAIADPPQDAKGIADHIRAWRENIGDLISGRKKPGILTEIPGLDDITCGGLRPGELWVLGGGTSSGKSAFGVQLAGNVLESGHAVYFESLEMPVGQVIDRIVCNRGGAFLNKLRDPVRYPLNNFDFSNIKRIMGKMETDWRLEIHDEDPDLVRILDGARSMKRRVGLDVLVIDYLQIATTSGTDHGTREREIAHISRTLKRFAISEGIAVIGLCQLNDAGELRESRAIGHDADLVAKIVDDGILIQKNRNGESGRTLPLTLDGARQRFVEVRKAAA